MNIIIFDRDERRIADLNPESIKSPKVIEDKEGLMNFSFSYSLQEEDAAAITGGNYVAFFDDLEAIWKEYEIVNTSEDDQFIAVQCDHRYTELATEEMVTWNTNEADDARIAMTYTLQGTRYQVGTIENTRTLKRSVFEKNPLEALRYIEREWGGVLRFRVELSGSGSHQFFVDLLERRGSFKGDRLEFGHNLKSFDHSVDFNLIKTAMYGRGKGKNIETNEDTQGLTFTEIEWSVANGDPVDKPLGQDWVGFEDKRLQYGKPDGNGGRNHAFGRYDSQAETPEGLLWETYFKLQETSDPVVNVRASVIDLEKLSPDFSHEQARLGDEDYLIAEYEGRSINLLAEIIRTERNPDDASETVIELGNYLPVQSKRLYEMEKNVSLQAARAGIYARAAVISEDGTIQTSVLDGVIDTIENEVHSSVGFVYQVPEGLLILNDDKDTGNPTNALLLSGGSFFLANSKNADGSWQWRTFGDGDGFIADELISGSIKTDFIEIFGNANFKWNGNNIYIYNPNDSTQQIRIGRYNGVDYGIGFSKDGGLTWKAALDFNGLNITFDQVGGLTGELDARDGRLEAKFGGGAGVNIIKNSTGLSNKDFWTVVNGGNIGINTSDTLVRMGYGAGFYFPSTASDRSLTQDFFVEVGSPITLSGVIEKTNSSSTNTYITITLREKQADGTYVVVQTFTVASADVTDGFEKFQLTHTPTVTDMRVVVYVASATVGTVAGLMLNYGTNAFQWTMANGEVYNVNVGMDINGFRVSKIVNAKEVNRTIMTPDKFGGYFDTNNDGTIDTTDDSIDEVFKMDEDSFVMKKAVVKESIEMGSCKSIFVNGGGHKGWVFVKKD